MPRRKLKSIYTIFYRDLAILVGGIWLFEFYLDYHLPEEDNLLLLFVGIPIIWATLTHLWTSFSYSEIENSFLQFVSHLLSILILFCSVFMVSAVLNTLNDTLGPLGRLMFHFVGWTVLVGMVIYDIVDIGRSGEA